MLNRQNLRYYENKNIVIRRLKLKKGHFLPLRKSKIWETPHINPKYDEKIEILGKSKIIVIRRLYG